MDSNTTSTAEGTTPEPSDGLAKIISTVVTITFVIIFVGVLCALYRLVCRPRGKDRGIVGKTTGKRKEFVDQFDVNCSQLDLEADEKKFINPAAKITSESESTSSNMSTTTPESGSALGMLVKSIHGDSAAKFTVSKVRDRSSRPSSLKIKVPKQFAADDEQFTLALIDKKSQTIHNLGMNDCVVVDREDDSGLTPNSLVFAQRWKEKARIRRTRGGSMEGRRSSNNNRVRVISRQASCPTALVTKGFQSESLSSHSEEDSSSQNDTMKHGASLSSIEETSHQPYTGAVFIQ